MKSYVWALEFQKHKKGAWRIWLIDRAWTRRDAALSATYSRLTFPKNTYRIAKYVREEPK